MQKKDRFIDALFDFLAEIAASLILVVIPLVGLIILSSIIPKKLYGKNPGWINDVFWISDNFVYFI